MNPRYYEHIPCGTALPLDNPHAFSVSMPTYQDVVDYEEEKNDIFARICSAYPRIVFHPYVVHAAEVIRARMTIDDNSRIYILPSFAAARQVAQLSNTSPIFWSFKHYIVVAFHISDEDSALRYYAFMKHCGYMIYSREAEAFLREEGVELPEFHEEIFHGGSKQRIKDVLIEGYGTVADLELTSSGMNAIYAGYEVIKQLGAKNGRSLFIQFGWIYTDTIHIMKKLSGEYIHIQNVQSLDELETLLKTRGSEVAGLITETISNPLLETPDIPGLSKLARKYGFPLMVDNTFGTPWNCNVTSYSDIIFESLTKFASGRGDIMSGVVILPENSSLDSSIMKSIRKYTVPMFRAEQQRLARTIGDYEDRMKQVNQNSARLVEYFNNHPKVERLHHVLEERNLENYSKISKGEIPYGGVISVVLKDDFASCYDNLELPKGPSLGCNFPLLMPYTQLAHYDLCTSKDGLNHLKKINLSPWLIRISVGEDNPELIIQKFQKIFEQ